MNTLSKTSNILVVCEDRRLLKIIDNLDVKTIDNCYEYIVNEAIGMREYGLSYKSIERILEEKLDCMPLYLRYGFRG